MFVIVIGVDYLSHQDQATKMRMWEVLAGIKKLTFTPGHWALFNTKSALVHGQYRNCDLILTTVYKKQGKSNYPYTRLSISGSGAKPVFLPKDGFPLGHPLTIPEVEKLLSSQPTYYQGNRSRLEVYNRGQAFIYEEAGVITDAPWLDRLLDILADLTTTYTRVLALGGDAVPALEKLADDNTNVLGLVARQLLKDIAEDTRYRLGRAGNRLICPNCLTGCASYDLSLGWWTSFTFYGCRTCRQSREFLEGSLVIILDNWLETERDEQRTEAIRVNWLHRRKLFDFEWVEIVAATDEEVERFAVQVGNDTDEWRKSRYTKMACKISAQCHLSENTLRILEQIFGEVVAEVQ